MQESINPSRLKTSLPRMEFCNREYLIDVEFHDDVDVEIGRHAFHHCIALRDPIRLLGVKDLPTGDRALGRRKRARKEICVTSGASITIKNVYPF